MRLRELSLQDVQNDACAEGVGLAAVRLVVQDFGGYVAGSPAPREDSSLVGLVLGQTEVRQD
jgi:hypothetical protein